MERTLNVISLSLLFIVTCGTWSRYHTYMLLPPVLIRYTPLEHWHKVSYLNFSPRRHSSTSLPLVHHWECLVCQKSCRNRIWITEYVIAWVVLHQCLLSPAEVP